MVTANSGGLPNSGLTLWPLLVRIFWCVGGGLGGTAVLPPFRFFFLSRLLGSVTLRPLEAVIRSKRHSLLFSPEYDAALTHLTSAAELHNPQLPPPTSNTFDLSGLLRKNVVLPRHVHKVLSDPGRRYYRG